jgi:CDP-archaeol synthase
MRRSAESECASCVFLPLLGGAFAHAPLLRFDLAPALRRPISGSLFGTHKTWRGALAMNAGTLAASLGLARVPAYRRRLPEAVAAHPALVGGLLGLALWAGELPNSAVKRRLGIAPGAHRATPLGVASSMFDQADWVPVAWLMLSPLWRMSVREAARMCLLVSAVHAPLNLVAYRLRIRRNPI